MNYITTSTGERITRATFDVRIRMAKQKKRKQQREEHGHTFCEECKINSNHAIIDTSHDISVDKCIKNGTPELAYDIDNLTMRCQEKCHKKHDGLDLQFKNI